MENVEDTINSQFANSPTLLQLIANMNQYIDPQTDFDEFYDFIWNVDTAQGFGLDIWGRIVGVSRVIPIPGTAHSFGFFNGDVPLDWENFGSASTPAVPGDPDWTDVALLLTFDGADGQTSATDSSSAMIPITFGTLGAALSTDTPMFGSASAHFLNVNGFGEYAIATAPYASGSQLDIFATDTWTIEFWFRVDQASTTSKINLLAYGSDLVGGVSSEVHIYASVNDADTVVTVGVEDYSNWGTGDTRTISGAGTTGTWHHFALVANGGTPVYYLDGIAGSALNASWIDSNYTHSGSTSVVMGNFGRQSGAPGLSGNMDELRVTAGVARYTANFTPPDMAFATNESIPAGGAGGGPFYAGQQNTGSFTLNDDAYRTLVLAKALANIAATTAPALNQLVTNLFPGRGKAYTIDGLDMSMTYVFEFSLSTIEFAILSFSGVLPHPGAVLTRILVAPVNAGFFGFVEMGLGVAPLGIGVFNS